MILELIIPSCLFSIPPNCLPTLYFFKIVRLKFHLLSSEVVSHTNTSSTWVTLKFWGLDSFHSYLLKEIYH